MRVVGGEPMRATGIESPRDSTFTGAWPMVRGELGRLTGRVDEQIEPAIRVIEAVVAGFHGIGPDADPEMADMFAVGARDRNRIAVLEEEVRNLRRALEELSPRVRL